VRNCLTIIVANSLEIVGDRWKQSQLHLTGYGPRDCRHICLKLFCILKQAFGAFIKNFSRGRQQNTPPMANKQLSIQGFFKQSNLAA